MKGSFYLCVRNEWPDWTKVGITSNIKKRLNMYQTSSPFRDYEFRTIIKTNHSNLLEDCVLIHFNKLVTPSEWINQPHDVVLSVTNDYLKKIEENAHEMKKWVDSKKEDVEGDAYKYVKYGREAAGSKYLYRVTSIEELLKLKESYSLEFDEKDVTINKWMSPVQLANQLNWYHSDNKPYAAMICSRAQYNTYGFERLSIR